MGLFGATRGWGTLLLKICHTYPTMMKIGSFTLPEEDPKNVTVTWHASWVVHTSTLFHRKSTNFAITANTDIQILFWYLIFNPFNFSWVFKYHFNKHRTIVMMSAKIATLVLLKRNLFCNKVYDVIIPVHSITTKILLRDSNYIVDVIMWPKFGNTSISVRESIITLML